MTKLFKSIFLSISMMVVAFVGVGQMAQAAEPFIYTQKSNNYGAGGYDVVAYFTDNQPIKGKQEHQTEWQGAMWLFSSAENRDKFTADPEQYAPQYGGYCAWAMAKGDLAKGNPKRWKIVDNKLYLNYNRTIQKLWERDIPGMIERGDAQWPDALTAQK